MCLMHYMYKKRNKNAALDFAFRGAAHSVEVKCPCFVLALPSSIALLCSHPVTHHNLLAHTHNDRVPEAFLARRAVFISK